MWQYVVLLLLPFMVERCNFINGKFYVIPQSRRTKVAMILFWSILLLLLVLRHNTVGVDLKTYQNIFQFCKVSGWSDALGRSAEIAYSALNKVISLYTDEFNWVKIVVAVMCVLPHMYVYSKYSTNATLSIALFATLSNFAMLFSGLRQSIAISLGLIAFEFVRRKKPVAFACIVIAAMLFHTSAFILAFLYPLYHIRLKKKSLIGIIPILGILFLFNKQIFGVLTLFLSAYTKYDATITPTGAYTMLILFALFAAFVYLIPKESSLDYDTLGMRNFLLFSVALQMFAPLHSIAMRMNYYYLVFIPLLIPRIISHRSERWNRVAVVSMCIMEVFFIIYFFLAASNNNVLQIFPYRFFWENIWS